MDQKEIIQKLRDLGVFNPDKIGDQSDFIEFREGRIISLGIHIGWSLHLSSDVEELISKFDKLLHLHISGQLRSIPNCVFKLSNLEILDLSYNSINQIPEEITKLSKLKKLILRDNQIEILPQYMIELQNLQYLDLSNNHLQKVASEAFQITSMEYLNLSNNLLEQIPTLVFPKLETCILDQNKLNQLIELDKIPLARIINLSDNQLEHLDQHISNLVHIEELNISRNELKNIPSIASSKLRVIDASVNHLKIFPQLLPNSLMSLNLADNQLKSVNFGQHNFDKLEYLNLNGNDFESFSIMGVSTLKQLYLRNNKISDDVHISDLDGLEVLDLAENSLKHIPDSILMLENLRHLILEENQLEILPIEIEALKSLQGLWLGRNKLSNIPATIFSLPNLKTLWLNHNQLESLPDSISSESLEKISLFSNKLQKLPLWLLKLRQIKSLNLNHNLFQELDIAFITSEQYKFIQLESNPLTENFKNKLKLLEKLGSLSTNFIL